MSINKVILIGRVGQEVNVRTVGDQKVASFSLATSEKFRGKDGNTVEQTEWHSITIWGRLAEVAEKYVTKGTQVYVEGKIKTEKYTDNSGNEKYVTRIIANSMQLLGGRSENQQNNSQPVAQQATAPQRQKATTPMPYPTEMDDSDLPF
jgi:single-strand DNA-binding protein